ncbi:MAG: HAD-IIIA family hydrolase [Proteobacteria bacterium]|uniref:3-deoxy-D-manno-octulosonate 8-phosphate phosphatase KdsC n=1 Tax=Candidatus Avisuccinivibrio stercorigallinarum TaxID=2840704 RepID=A0A9D9DAM9_9GAMM|nr:HAD-IIIA family hydrolase [Candidatus Avisuccinivibrio stercorigallinarum]
MSSILTCWGCIDARVMERLQRIKLVAFDVDGTLTDGGVYLDNKDGEFKKFNTKDGLGVAQLRKFGIHCAVITGRNSPIVTRRMQELKVDVVCQGIADKAEELARIKAELHLSQDETAAVGDDLNDLPMFSEAGFTFCPGDAHPYMLQVCDYVLPLEGGRGAVRVLSDLILMAQGKISPEGGLI